MTPQQKNRQLSRLLSYILERHPEEFGLIPDDAGYIKIKELLKALNETEGWRHIRESNLNELLLVDNNPPFEMKDNHIRATQRHHLPEPLPCRDVPKTLYTCVRKKAYPRVAEKGIPPAGHPHVVCTPDSDMALRMGKRKDRDPVLLTIHTAKAREEGVSFLHFTDRFYMAPYIPAGTFTGPSLSKMAEKEKKSAPAKAPKPQKEPGTFSVTPEMIQPEMIEPAAHKKNKAKKKNPAWKQDRKHRRKKDRASWPDEP